MAKKNIIIQANSGDIAFKLMELETNPITYFEQNSAPESEQEVHVLYINDKLANIVMSQAQTIDPKGIYICENPTTTNTFQTHSGYSIDINSTSTLKSIDAKETWLIEKSQKLIDLLRNEEVESGISNPSEYFVDKLLKQNKMMTLQMINKAYYDSIDDAHIKMGILHMNSHFDYDLVSPTLQTIAIAALSDYNDDVRDYAVQCFENWEHPDGIRALKSIHSDTVWLQQYIDNVIDTLSELFLERSSR